MPLSASPAMSTDQVVSVLLVDDDDMVREATAWMLEGAGYAVH